MLAAVLLQRDIAVLAGNKTMTGLLAGANMALIGKVSEPLVALVAQQDGGEWSVRR